MISPLTILLIALIALLSVAYVLGRRSGGMSRSVVVVLFVVAELWQFVIGAGSSLQLAAPGVGDRALWVPNILVGVSLTILPIGFVLCLWGTPVGRRLASLCALSTIVVAAVAAVTLSVPPFEVVGLGVEFALFAVPGLALLASAARMRLPSPVEAMAGPVDP